MYYTETDEEPANFEQKMLCVLCLDTSGSMSGDPINQLNAALQRFQQELLSDSVARNRVEVAIVTFDSVAQTIQGPELLTDFTMPTLTTTGSTAMAAGIQEAIDLVNVRKAYYKKHGMPYYRPWIVMMSDGDPDYDQDIDGMSRKIQDANEHKNFVFAAIGVGYDIKDATLQKLSKSIIPPMRIQAVNFGKFFQWLSRSIGVISNSKDGKGVTLNVGSTVINLDEAL